ncbi:MAG: hypothetical protein AAGJ40_20910 [Planctomycetota bacterium]
MQLALERDYVRLADVPRLYQFAVAEDTQAIVDYVWHTLIRVAETEDLPQPPPPVPDTWLNEDAFEKSHQQFLKSHPAWRKRLSDAGWLDHVSSDQDPVQEPSGLKIQLATLPISLFPDTSLEVSLYCPLEPLASNGEWNEESKRIHWQTSFDEDNPPLAVMTAIWAEPEMDHQKSIFGDVIVQDESLLEYTVWYESLTDSQQRTWDASIMTIDWSQPDALTQLESSFANTGTKLFDPGASILGAAQRD